MPAILHPLPSSDTKTCAGTYTACREAMVEILGTDLRTNCACSGTAGDFR